MINRRALLTTTAAAALSVSCLPAVASEKWVEFNPWQAEIEAVFEFLDSHGFTPQEQGRVMWVNPKHPSRTTNIVHDVVRWKIPDSPFIQARIEYVLGIKHSLTTLYQGDTQRQVAHLKHQWSDDVSVRQLMISGHLQDLQVAQMCAQIRI